MLSLFSSLLVFAIGPRVLSLHEENIEPSYRLILFLYCLQLYPRVAHLAEAVEFCIADQKGNVGMQQFRTTPTANKILT